MVLNSNMIKVAVHYPYQLCECYLDAPHRLTVGQLQNIITLGITLAVLRRMAPNLALSTLELIHDMINSDESLTTSQMAEAAGCSKYAIKRIRSNLQLFSSVRAPPNNVGRR